MFTRYVLGSAASWPEPIAILLMIVFTFLGAAAGYRAGVHIAVTMLRRRAAAALAPWRRLVADAAHGAALRCSCMVWGTKLVDATWHQYDRRVPVAPVGVTYLPIPIGGVITLLFVIERVRDRPAAGRSVRSPRTGRSPTTRRTLMESLVLLGSFFCC